MRLETLKLTQFRNYESESIRFHPGFNVLVGANGMGKTNVLDAVYYMCLGKSFFSQGDKLVVRHGSDFFRLEGRFDTLSGTDRVVVKSLPGNKKEIEVNAKKLARISDLVGRTGCVIVSPEDIHLLLEGSEERRNLLNNTIVQTDRGYLEHLLHYNHLLKSRNSLLKAFSEGKSYDPLLLESVSTGMTAPAAAIHAARRTLVSSLSPVFRDCYKAISGSAEMCDIAYQSQLAQNDLASLMQASLPRDRVLGRTTCGIHKDDLTFTMNGEPLKSFASQGQLKSFVLALRLAQYSVIRTASGSDPILLLDDIFDKLDQSRVRHLLTLLGTKDYGQVFITDTGPERMKAIMDETIGDYHIYEVISGRISEFSDSSPATNKPKK